MKWTVRKNHRSTLLLTGAPCLFTHLVQAHECVESFSCSHLCVVFLQDQHVKHQLEDQTMKHTERERKTL